MINKSFVPPLLPRGSFKGVPSHFRGWCYTASSGGSSGGYRRVGYQFGKNLIGYDPDDLEADEWFTVIRRMDEKFFGDIRSYDDVDFDGLRNWLRRHFPLMMPLIPTDRFERFVEGFVDAHKDGEMMADFPKEFEPVEVNLDDPCGGEGYIRVWFHRPTTREVVYQCPAPSCRDASRVVVETYAKRMRASIVDVGNGIAAVVSRGLGARKKLASEHIAS